MKKSLAILAVLILTAAARDCFGEECSHQPIGPRSNPDDHVGISRDIEMELRRQFWYYLRDSTLIYQANLEIPSRLILFYFHRNILGTFLTIASYYG